MLLSISVGNFDQLAAKFNQLCERKVDTLVDRARNIADKLTNAVNSLKKVGNRTIEFLRNFKDEHMPLNRVELRLKRLIEERCQIQFKHFKKVYHGKEINSINILFGN